MYDYPESNQNRFYPKRPAGVLCKNLTGHTVEVGQVVRLDRPERSDNFTFWWTVKALGQETDLLTDDYAVVLEETEAEGYFRCELIRYDVKLLPVRDNVSEFCGIGADNVLHNKGFGFYVYPGEPLNGMRPIMRIRRRWFGVGTATENAHYNDELESYSCTATFLEKEITVQWNSMTHDPTTERNPVVGSGQPVFFEYLTGFDPTDQPDTYPDDFISNRDSVKAIYLGSTQCMDHPIGSIAFFHGDIDLPGWETFTFTVYREEGYRDYIINSERVEHYRNGTTVNYSQMESPRLEGETPALSQHISFGDENSPTALRYPKKRVSL